MDQEITMLVIMDNFLASDEDMEKFIIILYYMGKYYFLYFSWNWSSLYNYLWKEFLEFIYLYKNFSLNVINYRNPLPLCNRVQFRLANETSCLSNHFSHHFPPNESLYLLRINRLIPKCSVSLFLSMILCAQLILGRK